MKKPERPPLSIYASPQEKYDNLLLAVFENFQDYQGHIISVPDIILRKRPEHYGFLNSSELVYYINALVKSGLLESFYPLRKINSTSGQFHTYESILMSFQGVNHCLSLLSSGKNSTRCFVAMKYNDDMAPYYDNGIFKAIEENGFRSIRIDREHADNEQTINDFIIASIKQSRFCVADLTHQSHGAYFEAGYALGRGLKVIYTCHEKDWNNLHFDVKSFQVLKYASVEELRERLSLKIQAFIMD
jgi:hypothetical protein